MQDGNKLSWQISSFVNRRQCGYRGCVGPTQAWGMTREAREVLFEIALDKDASVESLLERQEVGEEEFECGIHEKF